jgi:hypothetical protein
MVDVARACALACFDKDIKAYQEKIAQRANPLAVVDRLYAKQKAREQSLARRRARLQADELAQLRGPVITSEAKRQMRRMRVEDRLVACGAIAQKKRQQERQHALQELEVEPARLELTASAQRLHRTLEDQEAWDQRRQQKVLAARRAKEATVLDGCRFTPTVNQNSQALAWRVHGAYGDVPAHERLHEHGARHRARREGRGAATDERFPEPCLNRAVQNEFFKHGIGKENAKWNRRSQSCRAAENTLQCAAERLHAQAHQKHARVQARADAETVRARATANQATRMSTTSKLLCDQRAYDLGLGPRPDRVPTNSQPFAPAPRVEKEPPARVEVQWTPAPAITRPSSAPRPATVAERMASAADYFHPVAGLVDPRENTVSGETIVHARVQDYLAELPRGLGY